MWRIIPSSVLDACGNLLANFSKGMLGSKGMTKYKGINKAPKMFTRELIQAISDWQRGGDAKQKKRRGIQLKKVSTKISKRFRKVNLCCFRQVSLDSANLLKLGDTLYLKESISAWTLETAVAKEFKGGVPPSGYQGIIFEIVPKPEQVILNLHSLYNDQKFCKACKDFRNDIIGYTDGIDKYGNSQSEIILEIQKLPLDAVYALGGYSSNRPQIAEKYFGHPPNQDELRELDQLLAQAKHKLGPNWITGKIKDRIILKMLNIVEILKPFYKDKI